jgi:NAD(P)-dependent dehydrogenase (short-subunit alcohol dehydrogenase family)
LLADGWTVAIHDVTAEAAQTAAQEIGAVGGFGADFTDADAPAALMAAVTQTLGGLDALVNNAALTTRGDLETTDTALFDRLMAVNTRAPLFLIQAALPHFRAAGGGKVVTIGSTNGYCGERNLLPYAMSKGALMTMTRNLADRYGAEGIRVQLLNVGWTLSDSEYALKLAEGLPADWPERLPVGVAPSGGLLMPSDIAAMVAFLLSDDCPRINGSIIDCEQYPLLGRNPPKATT